ncbi:MAG: LbtU family siderophore porin [Bermanella sp.]
MKNSTQTLIKSACLLPVLALTIPAMANVETSSNHERSLLKRIHLLEKKLETQLENQSSILASSLSQRFNVSAVVELEAFVQDNENTNNSSDASLATVEVAIHSHLNPYVEAQVLLLHEDGADQELVVDEGFMALSAPDIPVTLVAGKQVLGFGNFESHFISDPLTLELAESKDTAIKVQFEHLGFYGSAYIFNGDVNEQDDNNEIKQAGAQLGYVRIHKDSQLKIGVDYISSLAESEGLVDYLQADDGDAEIQKTVPAASIHGFLSFNKWQLLAEYIGATHAFNKSDLSFATKGAQPSSYNLEVSYDFTVLGKPVTLAAAHQKSSEALALELPEQRNMLVASYPLYEKTAFALEFMQAKDYAVKDGGRNHTDYSLSMQLAAEF